VIPYLFGLSEADLHGPLAQFQAVVANEVGTRRLFEVVNAIADRRLSDSDLKNTFASWWPKIENRLASIQLLVPADKATKERRSERDVLEEILGHVRRLRRTSEESVTPMSQIIWGPDHFKELPPDAIAHFFSMELLPACIERARRDYEYIELSDEREAVRMRALELARESSI
jgi:hypothetical protein